MEHVSQPLQSPGHSRLAQKKSFRRVRHISFLSERRKDNEQIQIHLTQLRDPHNDYHLNAWSVALFSVSKSLKRIYTTVARGEIMTKTAIITGASGGIGKAIAVRLAGDGFSVVLHYQGNAAPVEQTIKQIQSAAGKAIGVSGDVTKPSDMANLFDKAVSEYKQVDVVVHCAGIMPLSPILKNDVEQFDKVIAINLRGTFLVLAQAAKHVVDGGRIMAFSSSVITKSTPTYGAYIASKAGVEGLVKVLAQELRGREISVNAVAPGPVATPLFLKDKKPEQIDQLSKIAPFERLGEPEDVAQVVSFLAGPDGGWINAQVVRANGGFA